MLKNLLNTAISLIFKPSEAWKELNKKQKEAHDSFLSEYVYPFMGMIILAAFLGAFFTGKERDLQIALKESIIVLLSVFGGFFLASYLVNEVWHHILHRETNIKLCQRFVGYSSSLLYCLNIVLSLLPEFFFLRFLVIYTFRSYFNVITFIARFERMFPFNVPIFFIYNGNIIPTAAGNG